MNKSTFCKGILPLLLLVSSIITSCKKESLVTDQPGQDSSTSEARTTYSVRNELLPFYYQDQNDVEHFTPSQARRTDYPGCDIDFEDNDEVTYLGSSVDYICGSSGSYTITMIWTFVLPANTIPSVGANTRIRYRFSTSDPYQYATTVNIGLQSSYTNPSTGQPVKKWYFSGTFPIPDGEYCMKNAFYGSMYKVQTDCSDVSEFTKAAVVDYLTPNTYAVSPLLAFDNATTPLTFTVNILTGLCFNCHEPALGACSEYIIRYRKVGTSGWSYYGINQAYSLPVINITVPSTGTYEYGYSGKLTTSGTFSPYKSPYPNTFTVL